MGREVSDELLPDAEEIAIKSMRRAIGGRVQTRTGPVPGSRVPAATRRRVAEERRDLGVHDLEGHSGNIRVRRTAVSSEHATVRCPRAVTPAASSRISQGARRGRTIPTNPMSRIAAKTLHAAAPSHHGSSSETKTAALSSERGTSTSVGFSCLRLEGPNDQLIDP